MCRQRLERDSQSLPSEFIVSPPRNCALSVLLTQHVPQSTLPFVGGGLTSTAQPPADRHYDSQLAILLTHEGKGAFFFF